MPYEVLREGTCPQLKEQSEGSLTFEIIRWEGDLYLWVWRDEPDPQAQEPGRISDQWIRLAPLLDFLSTRTEGKVIWGTTLQPFLSGNYNDGGFCMAALRGLGLVVAARDCAMSGGAYPSRLAPGFDAGAWLRETHALPAIRTVETDEPG